MTTTPSAADGSGDRTESAAPGDMPAGMDGGAGDVKAGLAETDGVIRTIDEHETPQERLSFPADMVERPHDRTRKRIAYGLLILLAAVDVYAFVLLTLTGPDAAAISDLLERIATPVIGLAGTAVGFYFGDRRK